MNAESALQRSLQQISAVFDRAEDSTCASAGDVADVVGRLCMNLRTAGDAADPFKGLEEPMVLVADEVTPSVIAQLDWSMLAALVTDAGSWTYHTAILARSLHIPAVAGLHNASAVISPGANVAVDGSSGEVIVDPDEQALAQVTPGGAIAKPTSSRSTNTGPAGGHPGRRLHPARGQHRSAGRCGPGRGTRGRGHRAVPIGVPARRRRTGRARRGGPVCAYRRLIEGAGGRRVTVRTFDVSEPQLDRARWGGARAPLGLRGIRLSLALDEIFQAQLRALLRAAQHGPLRIMFPFVSGVNELRAGSAAVRRAADTPAARGIAPHRCRSAS